MYISAEAPPEPVPATISWPNNPYKGLSYYTPIDAGLFAAREREIQLCANIVSDGDLKVLLLHGTTGCGKSSFLRAGLIPHLESSVDGFQFLRTFDAEDVKALFIRCTEAPLQRMCEVLYDWGDTPFRIDLPNTGPQELSLLPIRGEASSREEFVEANATSVEKLISVLRIVGKLLPRTVVLVIDQGEEILTLDPRDTKGNRRTFFDFLIAFSKATIDMKLIVALRKEYFGDFFPELDSRRYNRDKPRAFQLQELTNEQLVEAIRIPTSRNVRTKYLQGRRQPGDHYDFDFEFGLPETIVGNMQKAKTSGGILPVLQITCERLYRGAKDRWAKSFSTFGSTRLIRSSDYEKLGPPDSQVGQYIDEAIQAGIIEQFPDLKGFEFEEERDRWKDVLHAMVHKQSDNTALTLILSEYRFVEIAEEMECRANPTQMAQFLSQDERRILRNDPRGQSASAKPVPIFAGTQLNTSEKGDERHPDTDAAPLYYSLGHDAIAVDLDFWGSARTVIKKRREFVRGWLELANKIAGGYIILIAIAIAYASIDDWNFRALGRLFSNPANMFNALLWYAFLCIGANLFIFSKRLARHMDGIVIRSSIFKAFLMSPKAQS
ncbi:ATP-binding protein [Bradyrhizobium lablabi]|uniref:ATP-binding protein n=1 Tax=Bradyrhizobium lablabi TaxID=722472 RepID=UPI001BAC6383|nr:ATP-binding protein [Bradyrhizobium lablabi]MBR0697680.1 ATP-binding protein [Bradyrhizobium lablabi]